MGLAASQARFLGITARKSNIEYEGQQVNQQRTALAEEVNSLYNKLLALDVPVAPDTTQFYESKYSFSLTGTQNEDGDYIINNYYKNDDGTYRVYATRTYNAQVARQYRQYGVDDDKHKYQYHGKIETNEDGTGFVFSEGTGEKIPLDKTEVSKETRDLLEPAGVSFPPDKDGKQDNSIYVYTDAKSNIECYISVDDVKADNQTFTVYSLGDEQKTESKSFPNAVLTFDNNNRVSSFRETADSSEATVNTTRLHDDEGYEAALRDYTMSKDEYNKAVADLNAQTESLQQEDKVLELRLNQIDTEQNELQTELEAIKQILDKNIENTFKTFA